uniref:Lef-2 n=1 Tax=Cnaphalocrocis medinalis granulovirus TaxID=1750712 RepID=A0A109WQR7_9BBAC|nr:lef-2 [Cnaphalocrocis medinalis granulovirus]
MCERKRKNRYNDRLIFNYYVIKNFQCTNCNNSCIFNALKLYYKKDSKCVNQLIYLFQSHGFSF